MDIKATAPAMPPYEDYIKEIKGIWETGIMTNYGEKTDNFKKMLCSYTGLSNISLFVNGHSALLSLIRVLGLEGEAITSPFTFISTTNAIVQSGMTPVFGDIDDSYNLNPECIEGLITPKTQAIITPHIFGIPCDVEKIGEIARRHNLKVIYDGAQAFGTRIDGRFIGEYGDGTMFSFHAIKIFNSIEGGMLAYRDASLGSKLEKYRNFGIGYQEGSMDVEYVGFNGKMNEFQASMGIVNLPGLDEEIRKRKALAQIYIEHLRDVPGIETYNYQDGIDYNYSYFPIKVKEEYGHSRDTLWEGLREEGIGTRKLYDRLTCDFSCYREKGYYRRTEYADQVKNICLDLPLYGTLTKQEVECICERIGKLRER